MDVCLHCCYPLLRRTKASMDNQNSSNTFTALVVDDDQTPIIFFLSFTTVPDVVKAMRLGAVDFLEKPIEPEELLLTL